MAMEALGMGSHREPKNEENMEMGKSTQRGTVFFPNMEATTTRGRNPMPLIRLRLSGGGSGAVNVNRLQMQILKIERGSDFPLSAGCPFCQSLSFPPYFFA
jgi:hypothetical protein